MADGIKIGSLDISAFKVGSSDCKIYLGSTLLYPQSQPQTLQWVTFSNGDTIPSDLDIYGISGTAYNLQSAFGLGDPIYMDLSRNKVTINVDNSCYYEEDIPKDDIVRIIFSDYTCSDYYNQAATVRFPIQLYINSSPTPPTPTSYTYSVTIQGLENGDTTNIEWSNSDVQRTDSNLGNGTYTITTSEVYVQVIISSVQDYSLDYDNFYLDADDHFSKTVTFTHQGGGGGLESIPYGTYMPQYYNRYIKRIVIGDGTLVGSQCYINNWGQSSYISIAFWGVNGYGEFRGITSLPIDSTPSNPVQLELWEYTDSNWSTTNTNPFTDLQIEWA